eukprot:Gb_05227 [translate_table: standard]
MQFFLCFRCLNAFMLTDEVESLAAARQAALSGSEPSDSIRVVNALLTQLDRLKSWPNVVILTTSNITAAIGMAMNDISFYVVDSGLDCRIALTLIFINGVKYIAFVDRADIKAYVGPPTTQARYEILRSCFQELLRVGILVPSVVSLAPSAIIQYIDTWM